MSLSLLSSIGHWCVRPLPFHTTHIRGSVDQTGNQSNTRGTLHVDDSVDGDTQHSQSHHLRVQIKRVQARIQDVLHHICCFGTVCKYK